MNDIPPLRLKSIEVKRLFGLYDPRVDLNLAERVTILHGPNGVGKTMFLRMVNALSEGSYRLFGEVPFEQFALEFTDGSCLQLVFAPSKRSKKDQKALWVKLLHGEVEAGSYEVPRSRVWALETKALKEESLRKFRNVVVHRSDLHADQLELLFSDTQIRNRPALYDFVFPTPERAEDEWLSNIRDQIKVHLIEAQRLLRISPVESERRASGTEAAFTVLAYAKDIKERVKNTMQLYAQSSTALDQSFPQRVLGSHGSKLPRDILKQRMRLLENRISELKDVGLLDETQSQPFDIAALDNTNEFEESVLTLYVNDTEQKLSVLDDLARRARLLLDNINRKFHPRKRLRIDRERGLVAETGGGEPLELDKLSSGEQHELVLHYDLLFRVSPGTLVLIDEPELSLHVAWQKLFLPDLLEIVKAAQFDALIATHSPFVVGDRLDLMIGLGLNSDVL